MGDEAGACPKCRERLPDAGRFRAWCPACDWNIEAESTSRIVFDARPTLFDKALGRFGNRFAREQFEALLLVEEAALQPRMTRSRFLAYGLVLLVGLAYLGLLAIGLVLLWPLRLPASAVGLFLVLLLVVARPRLPRLDKRHLVTREEAPALFALIAEVSAALGTRLPDHVAIDADFNASFATVGFGRRSVLTIGLPFWAILSGPQRIALIGHELAHGINGDPLRGVILAGATRVLFRWMAIVTPDRLLGRWRNTLIALASVPFNLLLLLVAKLLHGLAFVLLTLIWHESQRAEYLADALAARVAGSQAAQSLLERLAGAECIRPVAERIAYQTQSQSDFFADFPRYVAALPALEAERLRRLQFREDVRFDSSHPPNIFRWRMLARHRLAAKVFLSPQADAAIDAELKAFRPDLQDSLIAAYFPHL